ncbi:L-alanine-DL-glutamate epimerase-like enolase superfamily enzyme [Kitasatospora sp. MAP12-15]|uniref:mandelate racemase/muconate lactonizing enzyme family protein n=1 Tax=unclassified Kitasatospora TaxID=2633591 RepID=UPI002475D26F|nr:enolase C-terminal domain-like protein [Kitasatospora sp. MAP12-44]MDH6112521.1 L-alanine-DL-glutamate epimerase-like enolase superfamily enzyme [Kitasatospora sp. MAP12-44]
MAEALLHHATLPMRVGFDHPAARRSRSDSLVLRLTVDGASGLGECAPRSYVTGETSASVTAALGALSLDGLFERLRHTDSRELLAALRADGFERTFGLGGGNNLVCLLETAVLDLLARRLQLPIARVLGPDTPTGAALPVSQVLDLGLPVEEFLATRGPFHFVKIKASESIERDVRTVRAVRDKLGPDVPVMVDANMSWDVEQAVRHIGALRGHGVDLVEEPVRKGAYRELAEIRRRTGMAIMLDESLSSLADARTAVAAGACDAFNVRVAKCGGLLRSNELIEFAREHGVAYQVGVQVAEVGPLIAAGRALAFHHGDAVTVEAGQSDRFFATMIVSPAPGVDRLGNTISPATGAGFGMELDASAEPYAVAAFTEGQDHWRPLGVSSKAEA